MQGDLCPFDHGLDPVVVDDVNLSTVLPPLGKPIEIVRQHGFISFGQKKKKILKEAVVFYFLFDNDLLVKILEKVKSVCENKNNMGAVDGRVRNPSNNK